MSTSFRRSNTQNTVCSQRTFARALYKCEAIQNSFHISPSDSFGNKETNQPCKGFYLYFKLLQTIFFIICYLLQYFFSRSKIPVFFEVVLLLPLAGVKCDCLAVLNDRHKKRYTILKIKNRCIIILLSKNVFGNYVSIQR